MGPSLMTKVAGSVSDIPNVLLRMQSRFDWTPRARQFEVVSAERIRSGILYRCRAPDVANHDVAVKLYRRPPPGALEATYLTALHLARKWGPPKGVVPIPILGWAPTPPCLCMPFVEGTDLREMLQSPDTTVDHDVELLLRRCGEALATYHTQLVPDEPRKAQAREEASIDVARISRRLAVGSMGDYVFQERRISRLYGDFGPHNIRVDSLGSIWMFDLPPRMSFGLIYKDLAVFTVGLKRILERRSAAADGCLRRFQSAFLDGYASIASPGMFTSLDWWMLRLYETDRTLRIARNLWRAGNYFAALRWASHSWQARKVVVDFRRGSSAQASSA
jgi:hypothetical protein